MKKLVHRIESFEIRIKLNTGIVNSCVKVNNN